MIFCATCGDRLPAGDGFCARCGTPADPTAGLANNPGEPEPGSGWGEVLQRLRRATLGEFEIGPELGRGAMAAVFLAHETSLDRKVAIKVMSPGMLMDEGMAERFKREAITIAHLNHPNIVSVHSVRQAEGLHFFVMRYIRGRSLEQVIQQAGRLPIPIVRSILSQVGSALTYAHRSGVVHRDIKPANILIDEDGNAVVTDFGIAKVADQPSETHPGALVGTPAYMSPEQCSGDEVSGSSDQYSLGAVAYEMITGSSPFIGSTLTVMQAHVEQPPQPIRDTCGDCPPDLEQAVLRMLEKDPEARWPSIAHAKAALGAAPLSDDDPLLAQLCRFASPDWTPSFTGRAAPTIARPKQFAAPPPTSPGRVRTISILPPPAALETGDSFNLVAMLRGEHGVPLPGRAVQWATDTPEVLRVDSVRGVATAVAPGSAQLTATCETARARLQVQVASPIADDSDTPADAGVVAIQISAPPKSVKAGDSFVLTASPLDYRGGLLLGPTVQWSTSDVRVAVITASGWVATLGQGPVVLQASCEEVTASVSINVEEAAPSTKRIRPPLSLPPKIESEAPIKPEVEKSPPIRRRRRVHSRRRGVLAASVGILLLTPVLWRYGGLREVMPTRSALSLRAPAIDRKALELPAADSVATILRGAPTAVTIERSPRSALLPGASTRLVAEVRDLAGRTVPGSDVRWSSTNPGVVRIDSATGVLHAVAPGRARAVAASGKWRASVPIVVRRPRGDSVAPAVTVLGDKSAAPRADTADREPTVQAYELETSYPEPTEGADPGGAVSSPGDGPPERDRLNATILAGVEQCYDALRSKDVARVTELYRPTKKSDDD
ncbi:MAG: protein kinase, partial [Geminicoccaceae bacterium]|nr:protein kinase [Geminicoccaceae bacterium]